MLNFSRMVSWYASLVILLLPAFAPAQNDSCGVFVKAADYLNHKLTLAQSCPCKSNQIKVGRNYIRLSISEGKFKGKYKLRGDTIFGIKTCKNRYRIQQGIQYKVINVELIPMYSRLIDIGGESSFYVERFYFSLSPESEIKDLSKVALKDTYTSNKDFLAYVDKSFKNNYELGVYNEQLKKYMLIYFYEKSIK